MEKKFLFFCFFSFCITGFLFSQEAENSLSYTVSAEYESNTAIEEKSQNIQIITTQQIEDSLALSTSELLEKLGNINVKQYGSYGSTSTLYIRNLSGSAVAVLIDGVQVNSAQSGEFDINRINPASIEKIEIVSGASDAKYSISGAAGGIINIITKKNEKKAFALIADIENKAFPQTKIDDTQKISINLSGNPKAKISENEKEQNLTGLEFWNIAGSFISAKNEYSYTNFQNKVKTKDDNSAKTTSANASLRFRFENDITLDFADSFYYGSVYCPGNQYSTTVGLQKDLFNSSSVNWKIPWAFNDLAEINSQFSYKYDQTHYDENINSNLDNTSLHKLHTLSSATLWKFFFDWGTFIPSIDFSWNYIDSTDCKISGDGRTERFETGFSTAFDFQLGKQISIFPSCTFLISSKGTENIVPIPKIGLSIKTNPVDINLNAYRMFVLPTLNQLYWKDSSYAIGNPNLNNEDGWGTDILFKFNIPLEKQKLLFETGAFATLYKNKIQWAYSSGKSKPQNVGKAAYFGGNIAINYSPTQWLNLSGRYDLSLSYLLTDDLTLKDNRRIMYTPENQFTLTSEIKLRNIFLSLTYSFTDLRYVSNMNIFYLEPYSLLDASIKISLTKEFTLYATGKNLTNTKYYEVEDYPMPGTSISLGLRYEM